MDKIKRSSSENVFKKAKYLNLLEDHKDLPRTVSTYINHQSKKINHKQDSSFMTYVRVKPSIMTANEIKSIQPHMREINEEKSIS